MGAQKKANAGRVRSNSGPFLFHVKREGHNSGSVSRETITKTPAGSLIRRAAMVS